MGDVPDEVYPPSSLRQRWPWLAALAVLIVAISVLSGRYLCVLIESPIIAPQRESPAVFIVLVAALWLILTAAAWGIVMIGGIVVGGRGRARRRWRGIALALIGSTWATIVVLYATDPLTIGRWATYWSHFYGHP